MKKIRNLFFYAFAIILIASCSSPETFETTSFYPAFKEKNISPDTHLKIMFDTIPIIGNTGKIQVFDSATDSLVDVIDMSIPAGPTIRDNNPDAIYTEVPYEFVDGNFTNANTKPGTPSGTGLPPSNDYQLTIIGGFTDAFHFYPIIVHENTATIYLHHNLLEYNKDYYVLIDSTVITPANGKFKGIYNKKTWRFSTKETAPAIKNNKLIVDDKGTGDFNTLQGAIDYIPNNYKDTVTVFIKNGVYEELIYFRNKSNIIIQGEDREKVIVQYANKEEFNPHPWNIKTNEWPGSFPSRRAAFAIDNCKNIQLLNLTVKNLLYGQAEGLLINGEEIIVKDVNIVGSGDALQTNGTAYFENISLDGAGDSILGRGAAFFLNCDLSSRGPFMWIRNTDANHGNVFVNCRFTGLGPNGTTFGRAPTNGGTSYPYTEAVLINCALKNITPAGWGAVGENTENIHYWEYNSTNIEDGKPVDVSQRADFSRQLTMDKDKEIIENYSNPAFVLGGWKPKPAI